MLHSFGLAWLRNILYMNSISNKSQGYTIMNNKVTKNPILTRRACFWHVALKSRLKEYDLISIKEQLSKKIHLTLVTKYASLITDK